MRKARGIAVTAFAIGSLVIGSLRSQCMAADTSTVMAPCLTATEQSDENLLSYDVPERANYFSWENDALAIGSGSDEAYTQGIQIGYRFDPRKMPKWLAKPAAGLCAALSRAGGPGHDRLVGAASLFIGQHLFTPHDISVSELIADDRPYAAWLYAGMRLEAFQVDDEANIDGAGTFHVLEAQVGTTGPPAQGEFIQTNFHRLIHDELPMGWAHEIPQEVGFYLRYNGSRRLFLHEVGGAVPFDIDSVGSVEAALGNIETYAQAGAMLRLGRHMGLAGPSTLGPTVLSLSQTKSAFALDAASAGRDCLWVMYECYLFVGVSGRAIAYNAFLEGTVFHGGHSVRKEPFVYDLTWGFRLRGETMQIDYTFVRRSKEFSPVPMGAEQRSGRHDYGSLMVRCMKNWTGVCPTFVLTVLAATFIQRKADEN